MPDLIEVKDRLLKEIKAEVLKECKEKLSVQLSLRYASALGKYTENDLQVIENEHLIIKKIINDL